MQARNRPAGERQMITRRACTYLHMSSRREPAPSINDQSLVSLLDLERQAFAGQQQARPYPDVPATRQAWRSPCVCRVRQVARAISPDIC
jgi:hypothetical protein